MTSTATLLLIKLKYQPRQKRTWLGSTAICVALNRSRLDPIIALHDVSLSTDIDRTFFPAPDKWRGRSLSTQKVQNKRRLRLHEGDINDKCLSHDLPPYWSSTSNEAPEGQSYQHSISVSILILFNPYLDENFISFRGRDSSFGKQTNASGYVWRPWRIRMLTLA